MVGAILSRPFLLIRWLHDTANNVGVRNASTQQSSHRENNPARLPWLESIEYEFSDEDYSIFLMPCYPLQGDEEDNA